MTKITLPRRDFLAITGAAMAASALPKIARAQGAMAPLNFGFQNTSWGTIGMIAESEDLFKKAGANVKILQIRQRQDHARRHDRRAASISA